MLLIKRISIALILVVIATSQAYALSVVKPWKTGVMSKADGTFAYCVTEAGFEDGKWLLVALNPNGDVNIGLGDKAAQMKVGEHRTLEVDIDGKLISFPAQVTKPQLVVVNTKKEPHILDRLANGTSINIGGTLLTLSGSSAAIAELKECVRVSSGSGVKSAKQSSVTSVASNKLSAQQKAIRVNPDQSGVLSDDIANQQFDSTLPTLPGERGMAPPPDFASVINQSAQQQPLDPNTTLVVVDDEADLPPKLETEKSEPALESITLTSSALPPIGKDLITKKVIKPEMSQPKPLPAPLAALLNEAGLKKIDVRVPQGQGELYAWAITGEGILGSIREGDVGSGHAVGDLLKQHLAYLDQTCPVAAFKSRLGITVSGKNDLQLVTADAYCTLQGDVVHTALVASLSDDGILSIISHRAVKQDRRLRDIQKQLIDVLQQNNN